MRVKGKCCGWGLRLLRLQLVLSAIPPHRGGILTGREHASATRSFRAQHKRAADHWQEWPQEHQRHALLRRRQQARSPGVPLSALHNAFVLDYPGQRVASRGLQFPNAQRPTRVGCINAEFGTIVEGRQLSRPDANWQSATGAGVPRGRAHDARAKAAGVGRNWFACW